MSFIAAAVNSIASGITSYINSGEEAKLIRQQSQIQAQQIQREAAAAAEAQNAEARALDRRSLMDMLEAGKEKFRAGEELRQGEIAQEKANIEQLKGEREAARRSRILAQEIGQQYAEFAGNGFAVDANPNDTFGYIIRSATTEGQADISTILDNAKMNQWTFEEEKRTQQRNAANSLQGANNLVFRAQSDAESAADARKAAATTLSNASQTAAETLAYGRKAAKATKKAGRLALISGLLGGGASAYTAWDSKYGGTGGGSGGSGSSSGSGGSGGGSSWAFW